MNFSSMEVKAVLGQLSSNKDTGLTRDRYIKGRGRNVLKAKKKKGFISLLISEFSNFMTVVLIAAAVVSWISGRMNGDNDFFEPILILAIVFLNAVMGVIQQLRAENAIEALKKLQTSQTDVLRDGERIRINSEDLTPGDIVFLSAGDKVCADMRIIECAEAECDESALTGEAVPVAKQNGVCIGEVSLHNMNNMLFSGTSLTSGHVKAVVCGIGMNTEMGKIADLINEEEESTPLEKKLEQLGKTLGIGAIIICVIIFIVGILKNIRPLDMFITSVSLAVAAIPEGLPAIVTVMLAIGVERMAKKNAVVKKLSAVETLGNANVICTDKTGTITQNRMTVTDTYTECPGMFGKIGYILSNGNCNPTDKAINEWFSKYDVKHRLIDEKPFDSKRKMMSALVMCDDRKICAVKGAAEIVLNRCTQIQKENITVAIDENVRTLYVRKIEEMAKNGLRVLALAYCEEEKIRENNLILCGIVGIKDPPRPEAKDAVAECKAAGIKVVMVTGDHRITASAIAREVGIYSDGDEVMEGKVLDTLSDKEFMSRLDAVTVFARVTPGQKLRIIKAYKAKGEIAAMTGDGVNDAPALKAADIGCSMGERGTDVAKEASDMVLADDNFATIVEAVKEGRRILINIKKSVMFLLSSNIGELLCVFLGLVMGVASPLSAPQLLWINLVTDSLPAIALGLDPADNNIMKRKPQKHTTLISTTDWVTILTEGTMIGALAMLAYTVGMIFFSSECGEAVGRTMAFIVLAVSQLIHSFNLRSKESVIGKRMFENGFLVMSFVVGVMLTVLLVVIEPARELFDVCVMTKECVLVCAGFSLVPLIVVEVAKKSEKYFKWKYGI